MQQVREPAGLRERKRRQTRQRIVDAAYALFSEHGFTGTTVAQIAESAEIATRTFFAYFPSKESVLFPEADDRIQIALDAVASKQADEGPVDVLLRALATALDRSDDMTGSMAELRLRLIVEEPTVAGLGAQTQMTAAREIGRILTDAFPQSLTSVEGAALAGAFVGASAAALTAAVETHESSPTHPIPIATQIHRAVSSVLAPRRSDA